MTAPDQTGVLVATLKEQAVRLGLSWKLRTATVVNGADRAAVTVTIDGDTVAIPAVSWIGALADGQRVFVVDVPPAGTYVVGSAGATLKVTNLVFKRSTGNLTLTGADQAVANTLTAVTTGSGVVQWEATAFFDFQETAGAAVDTGVGSLYVDGVIQTGTAVYTMGTTGDRATVGEQWSGSFAGDTSHTFELRALRTGAATVRANANTTTMLVKTYE